MYGVSLDDDGFVTKGKCAPAAEKRRRCGRDRGEKAGWKGDERRSRRDPAAERVEFYRVARSRRRKSGKNGRVARACSPFLSCRRLAPFYGATRRGLKKI